MKRKILFLIPLSLTLLITACSKAETAVPADSVSENENDSISFTETSMTESEAPESITTTSVSSQLDSSIAETTTTTTTTTAEDSLPQKPVIDESAISEAKSQLADNDIIVRKDTVRHYYPFSTKKCVLYITSCGDYYAAYYEREEVENEDRFWLGGIDETPQTIDEVDGAEYLGTLTDEEISELINFSLSVDPNAECYEDLRGEDETTPAIDRKTYDIYTFMIWNESHERTIYTAFVWDSLDYFLNSSDECAYAAVMIINHGDIFDKYYRYYGDKLELY